MGDLYRMYGRDNVLLYVGISGHAGARATQHAEDKPWWPQVVRIDIEHLSCDRDQLLAYEKRCIQTEKPVYNIQHNSRDVYDFRPKVKPFSVPKDVVVTSEWRALGKALADLVPFVRRRYGVGTLAECVVSTDKLNHPVSLLDLVDATARAAHIPTACAVCGSDTVPLYLEFIGTHSPTVHTLGACTSCHASSGHKFLEWETTL